MSFFDESLLNDFITESREHLNNIEPDLLAMEQAKGVVESETINRIFRAIHSIKGSSSFLAFDNLKKLSHRMESVLMRVRENELVPSPELVDRLLNAVDKLRAIIDDLTHSEQIPIVEEMASLEAFLDRPITDSAALGQVRDAAQGTEPQIMTFNLAQEAVQEAIRYGKHLYQIEVYPGIDLVNRQLSWEKFIENAQSMGQIIELSEEPSVIQERWEDDEFSLQILYASVLEPDLAPIGLELPAKQVRLLNRAEGISKPNTSEPQENTIEAAHAPEPQGAPSHETAARQPNESTSHNIARADHAETLRVRVDLLNRLVNLAGELVLGRNQLLRALDAHMKDLPGLQAILQNIDLVTSELQEGIMQTRMQPVGTVFSRFSRVVRDMARKLNKEIELVVEGSNVELDKSIIEMLSDPLTHLVRNSADHGIGLPEERERVHKPHSARITLRAFHQGGQVNISVSDDGRGIDPEKVLDKAIEKGLIRSNEADKLSEREIINLVFAPGFSTAEAISDISGRGVGMDVVRNNIEKLGGHIEVESKLGQGTTVLLRLPLTLAIIPSMIVGVGEHRFAVPQVNVVEFVWVRAADIHRRVEQVHGAEVLRLRDRLLPLIRLADVLNIPRIFIDPEENAPCEDRRERIADRRSSLPDAPDAAGRSPDRRKNWQSDYNIVVLRLGARQFGVIVDELFDIEEIVVKPLSEFVKGCKAFSGATILGDGRVIMIIDAGGLAAMARLRFMDLEEEEKRRLENQRAKELQQGRTQCSIILFNVAPNEYFALRQDQVLRLESLRLEQVQHIGSREFMEYHDRGLPLARLEQHLNVTPMPPSLQDAFVIIPKFLKNGVSTEPRMGILVSNIVDAMDVEVKLKKAQSIGPGIVGTAIVQGQLTMFLDAGELLDAAFGQTQPEEETMEAISE